MWRGWNLAFGKQSLWWGPDEGGALIFSDNAEPIYMFRASRIEPVHASLDFSLARPDEMGSFRRETLRQSNSRRGRSSTERK